MSMSDRDGLIWYDGKLVPWRDATTHVLTHTLHYGMGVFEGVRAYETPKGTAIFRLHEHTERLFNSAKIFQMNIPFSFDEVFEAQKAVVRENKLVSCYLRPLAFVGSEKLGIAATGNTINVIVAAWPWGAYLGTEGLEKGIRVKVSALPATMSMYPWSGLKPVATISTRFWPTRKPQPTVTMKPCCSIPKAMCQKAPARICLLLKRASCIPRMSPAVWMALPAAP